MPVTHGTTAPEPEVSPLHGCLVRSGAALITHDGAISAAHFGSAVSEASACLTHVGIADRSQRTTLELRGPAKIVDEAVNGLRVQAAPAWWAEVGRGRALVRCESADRERVLACLAPFDDLSVDAPAEPLAAIGLVGPYARDVLRACGPGMPGVDVFVLRESGSRYELLVGAAEGGRLWDRLLRAGAPMHIACVGFEALEHLAAADTAHEA